MVKTMDRKEKIEMYSEKPKKTKIEDITNDNDNMAEAQGAKMKTGTELNLVEADDKLNIHHQRADIKNTILYKDADDPSCPNSTPTIEQHDTKSNDTKTPSTAKEMRPLPPGGFTPTPTHT